MISFVLTNSLLSMGSLTPTIKIDDFGEPGPKKKGDYIFPCSTAEKQEL